LIERIDATLTRGAHAVYRFDVEGTVRFLIIDDGLILLTDNAGSADCTLEMSAAVLGGIARGEMNLNTAVMSGRIKVHGDLALALRLRDLVDASPAASSLGARR
jgi:putative sterol carrier protein